MVVSKNLFLKLPLILLPTVKKGREDVETAFKVRKPAREGDKIS
jgi:hypothetical protein